MAANYTSLRPPVVYVDSGVIQCGGGVVQALLFSYPLYMVVSKNIPAFLEPNNSL